MADTFTDNAFYSYEWQRMIIMELNREHESICHARRINLRPIAIVLFDSESHWGQYDHRTRTISISRQLVIKHSWQQVLGVFIHEMAHQYVAEHWPTQASSVKPHGELFSEACERLGVPEYFRQAGLDLQNHNLDWRLDPSTDAQDATQVKILDRVKKLLSLGASANENEAHLAMEKVREIYAKYNLAQMQQNAKQNFVHLIITHKKKRWENWQQRVISILTEHFFVKALTFQQFDALSGERFQAIELIGTKENVLMAEYVYHFLLQQVQSLLQQMLDQSSENLRTFSRAERSSYRLGVVDGFDQKLALAKKTQAKADAGSKSRAFAANTDSGNTFSSNPQSTQSGNSLSVIGEALRQFANHEQFEKYFSNIYPRLVRVRSQRVHVERDAFAAGRAAGHSLNLNKPVTSSMGNLGKRLN